MGSNQSSLGDRKRTLWPRRLSGRRGQSEQKTERSSVSSGGQYEHLKGANDNSERSSPSEALNFATRTRVRSSTSVDSSIKFCPCFHRSFQARQTKSRGDAAPSRNNDSVALLQVPGCSEHNATELGYDSSSLQEKLDQQSNVVSSQEKLSPGDDALVVAGKFRNNASSVDSMSSSDNALIQSRTEMNLSDVWTDMNDRSSFEQKTVLDDESQNEKWLAKKYRSFLFSLSSRGKSQSVSEQFSPDGRSTRPREGDDIKRNSETAEPDYLSNATSCEDSGKASEADACHFLFDRSSCVRAPIAKIDSLETTSIDSLDSEDLMLDTMVCSVTEIEKLGIKETGNLNLIQRDRGFERSKESTINRRRAESRPTNSGDAATDAALILFDNANGRGTMKRNRTDEAKWQRFSCQYPEANKATPLNDNRSSLPFDVLNADGDDHDLSRVFPKSSNWQSASNEECVVLDRETYSNLVTEVETFRAMLLRLSTVLYSQNVENDAENNNIMDPLAFENCRTDPCLHLDKKLDNSWFMQKLNLENQNLKKQITSLQTVAAEQHDSISDLRRRLDKMQSSMQRRNDEATVEMHSIQNFSPSG